MSTDLLRTGFFRVVQVKIEWVDFRKIRAGIAKGIKSCVIRFSKVQNAATTYEYRNEEK
jgi:hypothetical protein